MTVLTFCILGLATWRISALFSEEKGPFDIFFKMRKMSGIKHDENDKVFIIPHKFFAELLSCVWCTSVWAGIFWALLWFCSPSVSVAIALPFSLSALAIIVNRFL